MTQDDQGCGEATCILRTPIGPLKIVESGGFVVEVGLVSAMPGGAEPLACQFLPPESPLLLEASRQLDEYFARQRKSFQLPIKQTGTPFQQAVWQALQAIPYGQTRSYRDIAVSVGKPNAMRAVGQANNRNKILILVPCHRVIQKDGGLGGFACGVEAKRLLLQLEERV